MTTALTATIPNQFKVMLDNRSGVYVATLKEASQELRAFIGLNGFGASDMARSAGKVYRDGKHIATVSYNGRVWTTGVRQEIAI